MQVVRAIQLGFCGSFQERRELALTMYTDGALVGSVGCLWDWRVQMKGFSILCAM